MSIEKLQTIVSQFLKDLFPDNWRQIKLNNNKNEMEKVFVNTIRVALRARQELFAIELYAFCSDLNMEDEIARIMLYLNEISKTVCLICSDVPQFMQDGIITIRKDELEDIVMQNIKYCEAVELKINNLIKEIATAHDKKINKDNMLPEENNAEMLRAFLRAMANMPR